MDLSKALQHHCGNLKCEYILGESYDKLVWICKDHPKPSLEELELAWDNYLELRELNKYKELRAAEYPAIVDQLDLIFHGGIETWKAHIQEIKDKYPKPE